MIGCEIYESTNTAYTIYACYFYYNQNEITRFFPVLEGETIEYDVSLLNRCEFRGYTWSHIVKYIEYFRAIDGWKYHKRHHLDILSKVKRQIKDERRTLR